MGNSKRHQAAGFCAYCGNWFEKLTAEHVFPSGLYSPPPPNRHRLIVSARLECNHQKSKSDGEFRDAMVISSGALKHEEARRVFARKYLSAVRQNFSHVGRAVSKATVGPYLTSDGLLLLDQLTAELDPVPVGDVVGHMAVGLVYSITKQTVGPTHGIFMKDISSAVFDECFRIAKDDQLSFTGEEGKAVVEWGVTFSSERATCVPAVNCVLRFYGARSFIVMMTPKIVLSVEEMSEPVSVVSPFTQ